MNTSSHSHAPEEPVLPLSDIQGIVTPGFAKPHQTLVGIRLGDQFATITGFKRLLGELSAEISTAEQTLSDRRAFRQLRRVKQTRYPKEAQCSVLTALAFSAAGLLKLTPGAAAIPDVAFQQGLAARSALLGDPGDPAGEADPAAWKVGAPGKELDALFVIAGDAREDIDHAVNQLIARLTAVGVEAPYMENGDIRADMPGHEHFGFDDGISQPGIRGRASEAADDFITERMIAPDAVPESWLFGRPGQDLIWPGELILGHSASSPDPLVPGLPTPTVPAWTRNGSFLVFRRLRQDVGLFWRTMRDQAGELAKLSGFEQMTDEHLAALLVGRWPSGAPVNRTPDSDNEALGQEALANNHFRFDSDSLPLPLKHDHADGFPTATADPAGTTCPWAAHIRKVNTRDSGSDMGGRDSTYKRRVLRVGIPFGKPLADRYADTAADPEQGQRGLLFLGIQASIVNQFEFLSARWMNDPSRPKMPGGHDMLVGQNGAEEGRTRRCVLFGKQGHQTTIELNAQWIVPTGGGYFFVPSLYALRHVLSV